MPPVKVFISHGHNALVKHKLKDFVRERLHMEPVVLSEQPDHGLTVIEKLERYGKVCDFALIVLTADDETSEGGVRARQNVIHELGFFHGVLGREKVLLLKQSGVELFSNISGLIYKEFQGESIESVFEDVRLAVESGDASKHAKSIPRESTLAERKNELFTEGDWITTAILAPERVETILKKLASRATTDKPKSKDAAVSLVMMEGEKEISKLLAERQKFLAKASAGDSTTDEERLEACMGKVVAELLERELANFSWKAGEKPEDDPVQVLRGVIKAFVSAQRRKFRK